uniref:Uncharacterized protein n=1 Tax=Lepeophtheirus salmonis TaxID=72036 RepID=A0A0K2TD29_LEPSM
MEYLEGHREI